MQAIQASRPVPDNETHSYEEDLPWLRAQMLRRLVAVSAATGLAWFVVLTAFLEVFDLRTWPGPLFLLSVCGLAYWLMDRWGTLAVTLLYIAGLTLTLVLVGVTYHVAWVYLLLALPAGVASLLIHPNAGFATAGALAALALGRQFLALATVPVSGETLWLAALFTFLVAMVLWVAVYPLRTTMEWAWKSYDQAQKQTAAAQEHRAELARTYKDLDQAYRRLESTAKELEQARHIADEARRLKAEFATNISHELRTPLNLIIGFSEMLAMASHTYSDEPLPAAYRGDVQAIYRNARHLSNLIDDVLDLSQIEAGRMGLTREPVSIANVIAEAVHTVGQLLQAKGLSLTVDAGEQIPPVQADRTRIRQVLINLVSNATRFTDQGGIAVRAGAERGEGHGRSQRHGHWDCRSGPAQGFRGVQATGRLHAAPPRGQRPRPDHQQEVRRAPRGAHVGAERAGPGHYVLFQPAAAARVGPRSLSCRPGCLDALLGHPRRPAHGGGSRPRSRDRAPFPALPGRLSGGAGFRPRAGA